MTLLGSQRGKQQGFKESFLEVVLKGNSLLLMPSWPSKVPPQLPIHCSQWLLLLVLNFPVPATSMRVTFWDFQVFVA
jgi:hypothetical protein